MKRRNFLRNIVLGIAASLLPKVLQPINGELEDEYDDVRYYMGNFAMMIPHQPLWAWYSEDGGIKYTTEPNPEPITIAVKPANWA